MSRIFIKVSDVEKLTGDSKRTCYRTIQTIKDAYSKRKITISDYCKFFDLNESEVKDALIKS